MGTSFPSGALSAESVPRDESVDVVTDGNGAHGLNNATSLNTGKVCKLVDITNKLETDADITVTLRKDMRSYGDLELNGVNSGDEVTFSLADGNTQRVKMNVSDDTSLNGKMVYFHVNGSAPGLTVIAKNRTVPIDDSLPSTDCALV